MSRWSELNPHVKSGLMVVGHGVASGLTCLYVGVKLKQAVAIIAINVLGAAGRELDSFLNRNSNS